MFNPPPQVISGIEYTVCSPGDTGEMGRLLSESFTRHDPPAVAVDLTPVEFEDFVSLWSPAAGAEGLTIVARDVATQQLVGALLTDDAASPPPPGLDDLSGKFDPIFDLLGQIDAEYRTDRTIEPGQYLHLFLLGVAEQFARRKIGQHLVATCLANGADRGYTTAVTEATNPVSQHIFGQLGFQTGATRSYRDYRLDVWAPFASISEHGGPMTMDRDIAVDHD
jgi:ribosomal protein S18 acetylase RimI-like enzyme